MGDSDVEAATDKLLVHPSSLESVVKAEKNEVSMTVSLSLRGLARSCV